MLHAVIMAGGSGTRFWPASRRRRPKQLLNLLGPRTMIQLTVSRLGELVSPERTLVVTNANLVDAISAQLPQLPEEAVVGEPCKRDTAPCIGLAALLVSRHDPDATMAVLPADHVIKDHAAFRKALTFAAGLVETPEGSEESVGRIVTFGIRPTYPAESFGYIERGDPYSAPDRVEQAPAVYQVRRFREKPDAETARQYLQSGAYYWNGGIFVWKARTILDALAEHQPEMFERLERIGAAMGSAAYQEVLEREFEAIEPISIDYAVMEHATDLLVVEAPFDWDDIGSWKALARMRGTDQHGNTVSGRTLNLKSSGCIIRGDEDHLIVTLGVEDLIIVQTHNATLVANKDDEEAVRKIVDEIERRGWNDYL